MSVNVQNANVNYNKGLYVNVGYCLSTSLTENMEGKWPKISVVTCWLSPQTRYIDTFHSSKV